ncbi:MAG: dihydropyrimidinase [Candidatus Aminicenantes bacterium]|nr:dihydropyrimidinase [Candidatus Aminicenantes bacterium]
MTKILIKGGHVVTAGKVTQQDVLVEGEQITALGDIPGIEVHKEIPAQGLLVLPGAVDTHVHFNDEFMNTMSVHDYESGTLAAAFGGVTSVVDFSNQLPERPLLHTLEVKKQEAQGKAYVDWGVHPVITHLRPEILDEIPLLVQRGAPTIKCYMVYREEGLMVEEKDLKRIMKVLQKSGGMLMVHAEDNDLIEKHRSPLIQKGFTQAIYHARSRPPEAENRAIRRCIGLAEETGARLFFVHMSTKEGVDLVGEAQDKGVEVLAETCIHYLYFTEAQLERKDGIKWICSPPLRTQEHQDKLWQGLEKGQVAMVTTDDAAYSWEAKLKGRDRFDQCPNGIPGIEVRLPLLYSEGVSKGRLTVTQMAELISTRPAEIFGMAPKKGTLEPGADADIVLFDPEKKWIMSQDTLHMAADWTAYEGIEVTGRVEKVFSRGELIVDGPRFLGQKGRGRYIQRKLK